MYTTQQLKNFPIHAYTARYIHNEGVSRPEGFCDWQIIYTHSGCGTAEGKSLARRKIAKGDVMLIAPFTPHEYYQSGSENWMVTYITFGGQAAEDGLFDELGFELPFAVIHAEETEILFDFARAEFDEHSYADDLAMNAALYKTIALCAPCRDSFDSVEKKISPTADAAMRYLSEHFSERITFDDIVKYTGARAPSVEKCFKESFGITPWKCLMNLRIEKAKELLLDDEKMTVAAAGIMSGMGVDGITRHFKTHLGMTPGQFRAECLYAKRESALPVRVSDAQSVYSQEEELWQEVRTGNSWQIALCVGGQGKIIHEKGEEDIFPGDMFLLSPESECRISPAVFPWSVEKITFGGRYVRALLSALELDKCAVFRDIAHFGVRHNFSPDLSFDFESVFDKMISVQWNKSAASKIKKSYLMYELLTYAAILKMTGCGFEKDEEELLAPAVTLIKTRYGEDITASELAAAAGMGRGRLAEAFKNVYKKTPYEFLSDVRLDMAKRLLLSQNMTVKEIAAKTGLGTPHTFITRFKEREGVTPEEYRNLNLK